VVDLVKQEMVLLNDVDKPGSDVEEYVNNLDQILIQKMTMISQMREQLITFHKHLKTEEAMSKLYQQQQNLNGLNMPVGDDDEEMLIHMQDMENDENKFF
jgi:kinesin family protein 2/24